MKTFVPRLFGIVIAGVIAGSPLLRLSPPARAAGVVGSGTPGSCTEAALDAALMGGGTVTFDCGPSPATITVSNSFTIATQTVVDGGGLIALDGGGPTGILMVNAGVSLTLTGITVSGASSAADAAIVNQGILAVTDCTFTNNTSSAGAIDNLRRLTVTGSTFSNNIGGFSSGIFNHRKLTVKNCTFTNNTTPGDGALNNLGTAIVANSTFSGNSTAIGNSGGLTVSSSTFADSGNHAIINNGRLTVTGSTFVNNHAGNAGGAIASGNRLIVSNCTFFGNTAGVGGGISNEAGIGGHVSNCTFVNNSANKGGAISGVSDVSNTIIASPSDNNCSGVSGEHSIDTGTTCFQQLGPFGGNLSNTDPKVDPAGLANDGGPTQTVALQAGSPAINAGDEVVCRRRRVKNLDQRGFVRPGTGATNCSIGAYEFNSPGCPTTQAACSDICVNLRKDPANCGACGNACAAGQRCLLGVCR